MKNTIALISVLIVVLGSACQTGMRESDQDNTFTTWAPVPPMGWNSYDAYHGAITEKQFRECVDILAEKYLPLGYEYAVVDFCWFNPGPEGWDPENWKTFDISQKWEGDSAYSPVMTMDEYGRLLPSPNRFPSAANGKGFKELADYVHSKGMKFGIHIIRGIPRQAVAEGIQIMGTDIKAGDVITYLPRSWTNTMHIVDINKPGAQEYYNSLFNLYAEWGVDYVKADDMMKPFYHKGEIEMMHKAVMQCERPMVLSLSWGEAPLSYAAHLETNANLWRISPDFWDRWRDIESMFDRAARWAPFIGGGTWPDADMLPIGNLCLTGYPSGNKPEHMTQLSDDEIKTMMSLWAIIRSPLMWGGDPVTTPPEYEKYLLNKDVIAVNQESENNRMVWDRDSSRVWVADIPGTEDFYLALFNLKSTVQEVPFNFMWDNLTGSYQVNDLWDKADSGIVENEFSCNLNPHASALFRLKRIE
ncbi:MAG: glycoside hydrolase family 27 protein [Bacteroidales bacterium]|nr:glycoside hydrolase family 27 protein [Bacteroidales bacterium]